MTFGNRLVKNILSHLLVCSIGLITTSSVTAQNEQNLALNRAVTVNPPPSRNLSPNDTPEKLTDGLHANPQTPLWTQAGTVGWRITGKATITIDLGSVQPISGIVLSTGGGGKTNVGWSVTWPSAIYIATSDDGNTWHYAGDLVQLSVAPPKSREYTEWKYTTRNLNTHGRYLSLGIAGYPYIFADEVEVLRGDDALLKQPAGKVIAPMDDFLRQNQITAKAVQRQKQDIAAIRSLLQKVEIPTERKHALEAKLKQTSTATVNMALLPLDFKTILPLSDVHREILAVHGELLAARGFEPLTVWKSHRYAWRPLIDVPGKDTSPSLEFSLLKNQIRSDAILLTNSSNRPLKIDIELQRSSAGTSAGWLQLDHAIWTDTINNTPVQSALMPLKEQDGTYSMEIPAGITGKLWVTVDSSKMPAGLSQGALIIGNNDKRVVVPLNITVSPLAMKRPRLALTMWDFTQGDGRRAINKNNLEAAIRLMRSHYVNTPVASSLVGTPSPTDFDTNNKLKPEAKLDFSTMDQWVARWPGAKYYLIYRAGAKDPSFAGAKMGTSEFNARFGSWIKAIVEHGKTLGLKPSQLLFCFQDEPHNKTGDLAMIGPAQALKAFVPEAGVFSNPTWKDPTQGDPKAFQLADVLCTPGYAPEFYEQLRRDHGKQLWFYTTPPNTHVFDPQGFYRCYAWSVFAKRGTGMGWWSFGDARAPTSWNAYSTAFGGYSPVFLDEDNVYNSIHWDAVRDGVTDFEELSMLADAIVECPDPALKTQAQTVLDEAVRAVNDAYTKDAWAKQSNLLVVDEQLARVRTMLEKISL